MRIAIEEERKNAGKKVKKGIGQNRRKEGKKRGTTSICLFS